MAEMVVKALIYGAFPALLVYAAATDAISRKIPNWVSGAMLLGFVTLAFASGMPWSTFGMSLGVGFLALAFGFTMFAMNWMGGGGAKLIATTMPWFGATAAAVGYTMAFSIAGVIVTLPFMLRRFPAVEAVLVSNRYSARLLAPVKHSRETPYGIAIAAAGLLMVPVLAELHGLAGAH